MALPSYSASAITAVARAQQNMTLPQYVMGGRNASAYRLEKITTSYSFAVFRSPKYIRGVQFDVMRLTFPVYPAVTTNMTIIPVLYFDNATSSSIGTTVNSTNYSGAIEITMRPQNFASGVRGKNDFFVEFQVSGSALATIGLPIIIEIQTYTHA